MTKGLLCCNSKTESVEFVLWKESFYDEIIYLDLLSVLLWIVFPFDDQGLGSIYKFDS